MLQYLTSGHVVWGTKDGACGALTPAVIRKLSKWTQNRFYSKEAGGLMLGFVDSDTNGLLVEDLTVPGSGDQRSRTSFFRGERHQREAELWNIQTNGRGTQLGFWHTHPETNPTPSNTDINDIESVLRNGKFECNGFLYLIVGTQTIGYWYAHTGQPLIFLGYLKP
ncbi:TPA: Mov34/MPN/PAD-1 family protein [Serratia marcescens]|uniref:Mov34/MPN/PAD-1 family protein n=1 Tax=Serratia marcescens TaxID=615 RepID=UPI0029C1F76F|nr:Mov34/MPN/PAD-1 family protein [Serratia marcescens]